jgi:hypothetical protein
MLTATDPAVPSEILSAPAAATLIEDAESAPLAEKEATT